METSNVVQLPPFSVILWRGKWFCLLGAFIGSVMAFSASLMMTETYQAQVTMLPAEADDAGSGLLGLSGALGEITSLAGIAGPRTNTTEALETLRSREFLHGFVTSRGLVDDLIGSREQSQILANFGSDADIANTIITSRAVTAFRDSYLDVARDNSTGVVYLNVFWKDPGQAAIWANALVHTANDRLRERALQESQRRLEYLSEEAASTSIVGVRDAIYSVIESEIKQVSIVRATDEFAFKIIDHAVASEPQDYVRPNRVTLSFLGFLVGGFIALAGLAVRSGRKTG